MCASNIHVPTNSVFEHTTHGMVNILLTYLFAYMSWRPFSYGRPQPSWSTDKPKLSQLYTHRPNQWWGGGSRDKLRVQGIENAMYGLGLNLRIASLQVATWRSGPCTVCFWQGFSVGEKNIYSTVSGVPKSPTARQTHATRFTIKVSI